MSAQALRPGEPMGQGQDAMELTLRFSGDLRALRDDDRRALLDRSTSSDPEIKSRTAAIVQRVRSDGDQALRALARELDGAELDSLEVPRTAARRALDSLALPLRRGLERAARNIEAVHRASLPRAVEVSPEPGIVVGRRPDPLRCVGIYAPGGRAVYPSSVLMGAVPARVAGVGEIVLCTPPDASGQPAPLVLAAAELAGVDRIFAIGGAGAIAAMAYGSESVPRVDRIVGPGNAYVAEAKLQVAGAVAIDAPAGPSEVLVLADTRADGAFIARELVGQAEHDPLACAVAVVFPAKGETEHDAMRFAESIRRCIAPLAAAQPRAGIIQEALHRSGGVLTAQSAAAAITFANEYAAEHLILTCDDAAVHLREIRNTGTVFVGETSSNAFGDYMTGANHVLPTGGLARSYSGLSVLDFIRWTTWQRVDASGAASIASDVALLAESEGLPGHAAAARAFEVSGAPR